MKQLTQRNRNKINKAICDTAKGIYSDDCWYGKSLVVDALDNVCNELNLTYDVFDSEYHWEKGQMVSKKWWFKVYDDKHESFGVIICSGCGTVKNPLEKYDVIAYV
jgi:hypothetical protein